MSYSKELALLSAANTWLRTQDTSFLVGIDTIMLRVTKAASFLEVEPLGVVILEKIVTNEEYSLEHGRALLRDFNSHAVAFLDVIGDGEDYEVLVSKDQDGIYVVASANDPTSSLFDLFGLNRRGDLTGRANDVHLLEIGTLE